MNRWLIVTLGALAWLASLDQAVSQQAAAPHARAMFLIVDYERVASDTQALQAFYAELGDARTRQAAAHNLALDKLEQTFEAYRLNRDEIEPADYGEALKAFNDATVQMEQTLSEVEAELNAAGEAALAEFEAVRKQVEAEIVDKYRVERLLDGAAALYVRQDSGYDVTDELIERIDAHLPVLKLPVPKPQSPGTADALAAD